MPPAQACLADVDTGELAYTKKGLLTPKGRPLTKVERAQQKEREAERATAAVKLKERCVPPVREVLAC